ncbi:MAG: hypothetical protein LBF55_07535 [Prevotellaceae bacterium]|jgi:hypothetical protein|nr:hypothetical protein [Prevotellaceae bacterium]
MKTSELTKEQKLAVIDEILAKYERDERYQWYICHDLKHTARDKGYVSAFEKAVKLIPELLMVKPEDEDMIGAWFGDDEDPDNRPLRFEALHRLREIVMKS